MAAVASRSIGSAVRVEGIAKHFGPVCAVDQVSLEVAAGEFVSLLGPSGSGKTTLLMMIAGFESPTGGRLFIGGKDFTHVAPNKRGIGMVFQKYALFPHMTVAENIAFPLKMRKLDSREIARKVEEALALVRLEGYAERTPKQLSGGQQQRIAVARALVFEPPLLLMDEPLGALDKKLREQMQIEIKAIQERLGVTVIYVTHDQEEALTMSDRVAVMNAGRIAQVGSPIELYQHPASPFVADFIGKMNFIDGVFAGTERSRTVIRLSSQQSVRLSNSLNGSAWRPAANEAVRLAVRPERLGLAARGAGGPNAIAGSVQAAIFAGAFHVFLVSIDGRDTEPLQIHLSALGDRKRFERGEAVDIVLGDDAVQLYPAERG